MKKCPLGQKWSKASALSPDEEGVQSCSAPTAVGEGLTQHRATCRHFREPVVSPRKQLLVAGWATKSQPSLLFLAREARSTVSLAGKAEQPGSL